MTDERKPKSTPKNGPRRREGPLPDGHPFKGGAVFFTGNMSEAQKQRLRERLGPGRHSSNAARETEKSDG